MHTILLQSVQLTKTHYFRFLFVASLKRRLWLYGLVLFLSAILFALHRNPITFFPATYPFLSASILAIYFWRYVNDPMNRTFFQRRSYEINDDFIRCWSHDGTADQIPIERIVKVEKAAQCYYLYLAKEMFFFIPRSAFSSDIDLTDFEKLLRDRNLLSAQ